MGSAYLGNAFISSRLNRKSEITFVTKERYRASNLSWPSIGQGKMLAFVSLLSLELSGSNRGGGQSQNDFLESKSSSVL